MKSEIVSTVASKLSSGQAEERSRTVCPRFKLASWLSVASSCTHRRDGSVMTNIAGELASCRSGRSSCPGLMLRSTTMPSIGLASAKFWSTDSPPPP